ncbi:MAG: IclR family transcriptional regulator [Bacillota bacterium]
MSRQQYTVPAVEKALRILKYLKKRGSRSCSVTQIARELGINKGTCFTILQTLVAHNFVNFNENTKEYSLGWALPELAGAVMEQASWPKLARLKIKSLLDGTYFTGCIWKRVSFRRVILLDKIELENQTRITLPLGTRMPITAGSMGQCFTAFLPEEEREQLIKTELIKFTPHSLCDPEVFRKKIKEVQERGFAEDYEGYERGISGVSAPVFDAEGNVLTVLTLVTISSLYSKDVIRTYGQKLAECSREMTALLGGKFPGMR